MIRTEGREGGAVGPGLIEEQRLDGPRSSRSVAVMCRRGWSRGGFNSVAGDWAP